MLGLRNYAKTYVSTIAKSLVASTEPVRATGQHEGEGSDCFSITQLVGLKKQK